MENGNCALATRWRRGTTPGSVIPDTQVSNIRTRESYICLVVFEHIFYFSNIYIYIIIYIYTYIIYIYIGNVIIPTVTHSIIFQRGRPTTNQKTCFQKFRANGPPKAPNFMGSTEIQRAGDLSGSRTAGSPARPTSA